MLIEASKTRSGLALSTTSEIEIKNLLKQIDGMIHHKKLRWERQKQELDNKIYQKEQESQIQRTSLDQKNLEVRFNLVKINNNRKNCGPY